ncbi:MAG: LruC domain-containing protein [Bacteroidetes bacterium]|nr:LruC domain-containing protein [Bacteroidota bacterium]
MKPFSILRTSTTLAVALVLLSMLFIQTGCRKSSEPSTNVPTKFTELAINPSFQFDNFINLDITIGVFTSGSQQLSVIQIYQEDPKSGGKLIATGATDANAQFKTNQRVPSRLKELWIGKVSPEGINEYVSVPITGTTLNYTFGQSGTKSSSEITSNDCNTGTPIVNNGNYTVNSGQIFVVQPGVTVSNIGLTINQNGIVRICGTANITSLSGSGKLIISPSGYVTLPVPDLNGTIENYGTANCAQTGNDKKFQIKSDATLHNWGTLTMSNGLDVRGVFINEYHATVVQSLQTGEEGRIINYCQLFVNSASSEAFKITSGSTSNPGLVNNQNGYIKITGKTIFSGGAHISLGSQSLIETGVFNIEGDIVGPSSQGAQIHALGTTSSNVSSVSFTGYIDFWASSISPKNGSFGPNITWHNPGYTIASQDCSAPQSPVITSTLTAAGIVGQAITPYIITATGTGPITYTATNLPTGLSYNAATHTISGTPTTAQVRNVALTADNLVGTDSKTLVFTILGPGSAPVITSTLTAHTPVNQSFTYAVIASGTSPITYAATNLPSGLTFNATTHEITGSPASAGVYNIPISASNPYGTNNKTLILTVGTPPSISSSLTANGTTGQQFITYTVTASGSSPITYNATNLPGGLYFSEESHTIQGAPSQAAVVNVTLTASNEYGNDSKVLVITINEPVTPPQITSLLTAQGVKNQPFSYALTATGTQPIVLNAVNLPAGLSFSSEYGVISGIPTATGTTNVTLTASNSAGTDSKTLIISCVVLTPPLIDTDGDGISDGLDAYPTDATRAFNSYYPNEIDFASYAFEDLWPAFGDYDFNDLVMNFNYKIVTNAQNKVVDLIAKFKIKAAGASFDNGFGVSLNTLPSNIESVTGCIKVGSVVNIDPKGYEAGHTTNTVIIPVDAVNTLLGRSIINTVHGGYTVQTEIQTVTVHLSTPQTSIGTPPYNAFIFVNQDRAREVHLKDHPPTQLANPVYFGSMNDASNPALGFYYRSATGLPWGLEIPVDFDYPIEKADILQAYLHFAEWAQSSGAVYMDWYMDKPGYRNPSFIY